MENHGKKSILFFSQTTIIFIKTIKYHVNMFNLIYFLTLQPLK